MEIDNEIMIYVLDGFKRKDVNKQSKAKFIKKAMKELNLSNRKFAQEFNIPLTTLKDWIVFDKISDDEYQEYIKKGLTESEIFRILRNTKKEDVVKKFNEKVFDKNSIKNSISNGSELDKDLKTSIQLISKHIKIPKYTRDTEDFIIELIHMLNTIRSKLQ